VIVATVIFPFPPLGAFFESFANEDTPANTKQSTSAVNPIFLIASLLAVFVKSIY
jgi:hypothetical protein